MHSSGRRGPSPRPRALGSHPSKRMRATLSVSFANMIEPTFSPFISAIQQRSRFRSNLLTKSATIRAHKAFERRDPAKLLAVQRGVTFDDPAEIAGFRRPQGVSAFCGRTVW